MIIAILVIGLFGYGIHGAYQDERKSSGLSCETSKASKCHGFSRANGFKTVLKEDDFDSLTDADFSATKEGE